MLAITGTAYRYADPSAHSPEPVNFGIVHVGDLAPSQILSLTNSAAADGFSESLDASIGSPTGGVATNSGSFTGLAAGLTNSVALSVGIDTTTAGVKTGTATISLTSSGAGTSGLGDTSLSSQTVNVQGTVNNYAVATIAKQSGDGLFTPSGANEFSLDLGSIVEGQAPLSATLGVSNTAAAPADDLAGSFVLQADDFGLTGFTSFSNLAAGATQGGLVVSLDDSHVGAFNGQITLVPQSTNPQPFSQNLPQIVIHLTGQVRLGGDYNQDGTVNAADYTVWRNMLGQSVAPGTGADGTGPGDTPDGMVTRLDYDYWKSRYGATAPAAGSQTNVPEPMTLLLVLAALLGLAPVWRR